MYNLWTSECDTRTEIISIIIIISSNTTITITMVLVTLKTFFQRGSHELISYQRCCKYVYISFMQMLYLDVFSISRTLQQ